jgi:hypothetical protein
MPSPNANPTPITPPRVPLIDPRTGLIDRAWYLFFLSLNNAATAIIDDSGLTFSAESTIASVDAELRTLAQFAETLPPSIDLNSELIKQIDAAALADCCSALVSQVAELQKQIEALQVQPIVDVGAINAAIAALSSAPATYAADFSVAATNVWIINNKSGSSCTVTLPTASISAGRVLYFQNYQAQTLVSASSNVVPLAGGAATTAILEAVAGANATLVSDGTNWIMTQYSSNNSLQLE